LGVDKVEKVCYYIVEVQETCTKQMGGESMAENKEKITNIGDDAEMMSDGTLKRLIDYLKSVGWSDSQIVALLDYITSK